MKTLTYKGFIAEDECGDKCDALFIGDTVIAKELSDEIENKQISVQYWIADKEMTKDELQEGMLKKLFGTIDVEYWASYSDVTGYLWTNQELKVGGHDLLDELQSNLGKYIYLEIDVH